MKTKKTVLAIGLILCIAGVAFWARQLTGGMHVTNLRNNFSWGLYIGSFEFFVALATGGFLVYAIAHLWDVKALRPFTLLASAEALACLGAAGVAIMTDLGAPFRMLYMFFTPNVKSPLFWDVLIMSAAAILGIVMVLTKDRFARVLAPLSLAVAVLLSIVTSLLFATQNAREWWHSALLPVNAVCEATAAGLAFMILLISLTKGEDIVPAQQGITILTRIASCAILLYLVMTLIEIIPLAWSGTQASSHLLSVLFRDYGILFALMILLPFIAMIGFFRSRQPHGTLVICSAVLAMAGIFIQRMMLIMPAFAVSPMTLSVDGTPWVYPASTGVFIEGEDLFVRQWHYAPSLTEWGVCLLPAGVVFFAIALLLMLFSNNKEHAKIET